MASDTITGLRIGGKTYAQGRHYRRLQLPQLLLPRQLDPGSRLMVDITGNQLTITATHRTGALVGRFVARGKALVDASAHGIARDFRVRQVVEVQQRLRGSGRQLLVGRAKAERRFSLNAAYQERSVASWRTPTFSRSEQHPALGFAALGTEPWWQS
jgi:hypothetical protein